MTTKSAIDELKDWASLHGLAFQEFEHWGEIAQRAVLVDSGGDTYEFFVGTDTQNQAIFNVGVALVKRGASRHHALRAERDRFAYSESVQANCIGKALESCYSVANEWIAASGNSLTKS